METIAVKPETEQNVDIASSDRDPWREVSWIPCTLSVALPIRGVKVRDLLAFAVETVLDSHQPVASSLPVWVNGVMIGQAEFDVVGNRLTVLINELR
jgi:flagellar motor switch/type III secretory pathway protein FliN